ncbi:hypothetical protein IE81DRAFT_298817 [Ceraceosorus guamensis]|uniref:hydroxymethylbilane synthase n=1 Tax=Ceraceosorus guamensis TaxID=1522189 RepID=A0A316W455_9BASI|nr:hypothetical protein IE81DRAFT_298817 [Ceraceosorus guamensis]PWN44509.1 hypothetical protein IE81DRAFT_298817 [Ceraceosorus guamensis]
MASSTVYVERHPDEGTAQCPVAHDPAQPLPPGHPPTSSHPASSLKPPTAPGCIFFRTTDDLIVTPPLSRVASAKLDDLKAAANINPLAPGAGQSLDPDTSLVLASRNSQLALVQSSHVSAMLSSHYSHRSPAFVSFTREQAALAGQSSSAKADSTITPPSTPPSLPSLPTFDAETISTAQSRIAALGIPGPCSFPITSMSTAGDHNQRSPLYVIGGDGKAIWTKELEVALSGGAVDAIVHCLKDVPTALPDGLMLGAIMEREDPRDALVVKKGLPYKTLDELPPGSVIGTSSVRRVAQLRRRYPELVFSDVRGNLNTRLSKLDAPNGPYTALVLAAAGLIRLNLTARITAFLSAPVLMYSVGQGALAIEVRTPPPGADPRTNREARILEMIRSISDWRATWRAEAERALLRELEGGCSIPVGVETRFADHAEVEGQRNEGEALRLVAASRGVDVGDTREEEGHTIPPDEITSSSGAPTRPAALERLNTDKLDVAAAQAASTSATPAPTPAIKAAEEYYPEDRAAAPAEGAELTLHAIVVSLDGKRSCDYTLTRHCMDVADAQALGRAVAQELAQSRGARAILEEVERHRKLAEAADERRRREGRAQRVAEVAGKAEAVAHEGYGLEGRREEKQSLEAIDEAEARRKLQEVLEAAKNGDRTRSGSLLNGDVPHGLLANETDRRGIPRSDGLPKAWEV